MIIQNIQTGLESLVEADAVQKNVMYILIDCQSSIRTAFEDDLPRNIIEIILDIKIT